MSTTTTLYCTLTTETCCNCGTPFGIESGLHRTLRGDPNQWFSCPNGHRQHYSKSTEQRLREELDQKQKRITELSCEVADQRSAKYVECSQKKRFATMLHNHRVRAKVGVCPCCNRTFKQLAAHMETKHPDFMRKTA